MLTPQTSNPSNTITTATENIVSENHNTRACLFVGGGKPKFVFLGSLTS
jgi:hypothetical protein